MPVHFLLLDLNNCESGDREAIQRGLFENDLHKAENHDPTQCRADLVTKHRVGHMREARANLKGMQAFVGELGAILISGSWRLATIMRKPRKA